MKKINIKSTILLLLLGSFLFSCANGRVYKGDRFYDGIAYSKAIPFYEKVYKKHPEKVGHQLADAYYQVGDSESSEAVYRRLIETGNEDQVDYVQYGRVLMMNGKYDEAQEVLNTYTSSHPDDAHAATLLASTNVLDDRFKDTTLYTLTPVRLPDFTNSYAATPYGERVVFVADQVAKGKKKNAWTGNSYLNLYEMQKSEQGNWSSPKLLEGNINGKYHDGPAVFSADGKTMYFTRSNYNKKKLAVNENDENNLKLLSAELVNGEWSNLTELPFNSDDYSVGHPALSADGNTLYFISDMPGGFGGTDLYSSTKSGDSWGQPVNLGSAVNTPENEMFPYMDQDGYLYFSSEGHNSMGGLDIFVTKESNSWTKPQNLDYPVNSSEDDFGFVLNEDGRTGYLSSSRGGADAIYEFIKHPPVFNVIVFAHEKGSDIPVQGATIEIKNMDGETSTVLQTGADGKVQSSLDIETLYNVLASRDEHFAKSEEVNTKGLRYSEDFYLDFEFDKVVIDEPIVIKNIYFDFDKSNIRPDAAKELDHLVKVLKDNPRLEVELGSHTDARGTDKYNEKLSDRRAKSTVDYLIKKGIAKDRLTWKGYGENNLTNECKDGVQCSEEKHQANRRTEFKVTKVRD